MALALLLVLQIFVMRRRESSREPIVLVMSVDHDLETKETTSSTLESVRIDL